MVGMGELFFWRLTHKTMYMIILFGLRVTGMGGGGGRGGWGKCLI